jgi:hypothetical protein
VRRVDAIHGVNQVCSALKGSGLEKTINFLMGPSSSRNNPKNITMLLKGLKYYSVEANKYSPAARQIARELGLEKIEDTEVWSSIFLPSDENRHAFYEIRRSIDLITNYLPKFAKIFETKTIMEIDEIEKAGPLVSNNRYISVILIENDDQASTAERAKTAIESIMELYSACATMHDVNGDTLVFASCDSGSDKSFDFLGAAKIIECVKEIVLSMWDRVVFYKEKKLSQHMDLITQSLPIIEKISDMETKKSISPEQAEILRRKINSGVTKFINCGCVIPELDSHSQTNPRLLMAPERKLLSAPEKQIDTQKVYEEFEEVNGEPEAGEEEPANVEDDKDSHSDLSVEEKELLKQLLKKESAKKKNKKESK